jgi:hypothetical protein
MFTGDDQPRTEAELERYAEAAVRAFLIGHVKWLQDSPSPIEEGSEGSPFVYVRPVAGGPGRGKLGIGGGVGVGAGVGICRGSPTTAMPPTMLGMGNVSVWTPVAMSTR